ncbi:ABC-type branched-chain amino acid transport system, permease component [Desulfosporosinus orientis DSM 765]|uniref:ABC-type branched-chain amino acid transport system, permease component n=1 Tax=Desulfosporosinus orientis (strain ATCC 19365 / DSM 765 / NCIMB 8382 / VKM B-1628 / Singapore I) TaxID=768706 RepID=G7W8I5_DESOD|nr:branched-chain amino acid ABC transporter permease [Desulfosporosinus orientis]AET67412.1 ABC-type branched-chain amino acid transport system, permease component [Desulfosporosinus orientis DSM 765]
MEKAERGFRKGMRFLRKFGLTPFGMAMLFALAVFPLVIQDEVITRLLISALMLGALAMAFDFTAGFININNFGYAAFWGVGAYTSALLAVKLGVSPWLGMLAGGVFAGLLGLGLGFLTLRLAGIFASCMTWFVALAMFAVTANWVELTRGTSGLSVPPLFHTTENIGYYYTIFVMTILTYVGLRVIINSHIGTAFRAIGQDIQAAQASGINVTKYKIMNFTISCAIAGVLGGFYAHFVGIITPTVMNTSHTVEIMVLSYVGGRGTIWGGLVAGLIMIPGMEYLKGLLELRLLIYGVLMIMVMIFFPNGLAGLYNKFFNLLGESFFEKGQRVKKGGEERGGRAEMKN